MSKSLRKKLAGSLKLVTSLSSSNTAQEPVVVLAKQPSAPPPPQFAAQSPTSPAHITAFADTEPDDATYDDAVDVRVYCNRIVYHHIPCRPSCIPTPTKRVAWAAQTRPHSSHSAGTALDSLCLPTAHPRSVITDLVKQIGRQLLAGKLNLINVSLPVKIFEPRSYLEKLTDVWVYPQCVLMVVFVMGVSCRR